MAEFGLFTIGTVSFPEAIVFSIIILFAIGRRDLLNMKKKSNVFKFIFVVIIMTMIPITTRHFSSFFYSVQAVQALLAVLLFKFVYKLEWYNVLIGYLINFIVCGIIEVVCFISTSMITGININEININEQIKALFTIGPKIFHTLFIIILFKTKFVFVNLRAIKFTKNIIKNLSMLYLTLGLCFLLILITGNYFMFEFPVIKTIREIRFIITFISIMTIVCILLVAHSVKMAKKIEKTTKFEKNEQLHNSLITRALLYDVKSDKMTIDEVIEIITNKMIIGGGLVKDETKKS
jgi:hypothetical protein